jgi:type II secretory pathway component PulF
METTPEIPSDDPALLRRPIGDIVGMAMANVVVVGAVAAIAIFIAGWIAAWVAAVTTTMLLGWSMTLRWRRAATVVDFLEQAVRMNLPLPWMLHAAAAGERGALRVALLRVRDSLTEGRSVSDALAAALPELPLRDRELITVAERLGQLPQTLGYLVRRTCWRGDAGRASRSSAAIYLMTMTAAVGLVLAGGALLVLPRMNQIFEDFGVQMPWLPRSISEAFDPSGLTPDFVVIVAAITVAALTAVAMILSLIFPGAGMERPLRGVRRGISVVLDPLVWSLPVFGNMAAQRGLGDVMLVLSAAAQSGVPLTTALGEARRLAINGVLRRRVARWGEMMENGKGLSDAAKRAGLPGLVWGTLGAAQTTGDPAAGLEFLQLYYAGRFSRSVARLEAMALPAAVVLIGVMVGAVDLAVFEPMIRLIDAAIQQTGFN